MSCTTGAIQTHFTQHSKHMKSKHHFEVTYLPTATVMMLEQD